MTRIAASRLQPHLRGKKVPDLQQAQLIEADQQYLLSELIYGDIADSSDHPDHPALARKLRTCLRWRNARARYPVVLAAQRRERARIRSERQQRWDARSLKRPDRAGERSWPAR